MMKRITTPLSIIFKASNKSEVLSNIIEKGQLFDPVYLTVDEAYQLLKILNFSNSVELDLDFLLGGKRKQDTHSSKHRGNF